MESQCNYLRSPTNNYIEKKKDPNSAIHYITVGNHSCIMCTFPQGGQNHTKVCFSPFSSSLCLHTAALLLRQQYTLQTIWLNSSELIWQCSGVYRILTQSELNRWSQFSEQKLIFFFKSENLKKMLLIKIMGIQGLYKTKKSWSGCSCHH